jgi:rhamnosyltransferase
VDRDSPNTRLYGPLGFFTDANGAVRRSAWERVPFPPVVYAEDHALAIAMLRAGFAKAFVPRAAVVHSHEYSLRDWLRRSFDESRAVADLYGVPEIGSARRLISGVRGAVGADRRDGARGGELLASALHHGVRGLGMGLGVRAERLPASARRRLSLEGRV